jgi:hypothetical protein
MYSSFQPPAYPVLKVRRCKAKTPQTIGRQLGTRAALLSKGRDAVKCKRREVAIQRFLVPS